MERHVCFSISDLIEIGTAITIILSIYCYLLQRNFKLEIRNLQEQIKEKDINKTVLLEERLKAQEEEKVRIGRNLHDDLGSSLASLRLQVDMAEYTHLNQVAFDEFKSNCKKQIDELINNVRRVSHNLSPISFELYGLMAAIEDLVDSLNITGKLKISIQNQAEVTLYNIQQDIALPLFRILQELLTNTIRHAKATNVLISFSESDQYLIIRYGDNGKGLDWPIPKGLGFNNIENRLQVLNAIYTITTAKGEGFTIDIIVPIL
jgi:signal transduction histidine kinase